MKSDWLDHLEDQMAPVSDKVPKGYYSANTAAKHWGITVQSAKRRLKMAERAGLSKKVMFRVGYKKRLYSVAYYGPK